MSATRGERAVAGLAQPPAGVWGLSTDEVTRRLALDGPNTIVPAHPRGGVRRLLRPFADPMVLLLLVAAPTYLLIGDTVDAAVAFVALVPVAAIGWILESRAEHALEALRRLTMPTAEVWRDGRNVVVTAEELVVGDVIWVREGDVVPADGTILDLTQLLVDESALTGESLPVAKSIERPDASVYAGTTVLSGRAVVRVETTGAGTRYGQIGALLAATGAPLTPLQRAMARLVRRLAVVAAVFCGAVVAAELLRGRGVGDAVIAGVSLAIAAIPEEFSVVYTLYLAIGAWRLTRDRALVRRLPGVETLGSTTVICTDKTGTLTEGRLAVAGAAAAPGIDESQLLAAAVLACEPDPYDPLDVAIVTFAEERGVDVAALHGGRLIDDWPFDPTDKYLTHVWQRDGGMSVVAAKGALEGVLAHAAADDATRVWAERRHAELAEAGTRVIAVAGGTNARPTGERARDESGLSLLGLVAFDDPIRDGVGDALAECRAAGIRVIMITGDHPTTARAVARGLGIVDGEAADVVVTGDDIDAADSGELDRLVQTANVFARTRPEQKQLLVDALRNDGEVVAMTGDGINDAPALRAADIGVAMGQRGSEVAREAATLVLLDDNFATIVHAVANGRRIYDNLTRAFGYLIAFHPPLLIAALVVPLLGKPLLLLPVHLVLLELLLHPIVSLVFQADPADDDVMRRPPRPSNYALRARALWRPGVIGLTLAAGIVAAYLVALGAGWPVQQARGLAFTILLVSQAPLLVVERSPGRAVWRTSVSVTRELVLALVSIGMTIFVMLYVRAAADLLQVEPFAARWWLVVAGVAAACTLWSEPLKRSVD